MIVTQDLQKHFGSKMAVSPLNLTIPEGTFYCFLGPNGAGKTTTIKMLTGLLKPSSGHALLGGIDIQKDPVGAKRLLGYVPDHPFLYDKLTGREFMRFVAGLYQITSAYYDEHCETLLEMFEVAHVADQLIEDYSHGMRQKLSFASCFLHHPRIVIVDEPWVGLDPKNIRFVKDFLKKKTREEGLTVFMSTHTLSIAEEVADRIGVINQGKLLFTGTVEEIKSVHQNPGSLEDVFLKLTGDSDGEEAAA
ncbi:MAG: ABC transporter ATP-binding protein [Candidatus Hydrogenedentes bacterium]|nr:ABC transporter ATP-binding protein [Candidatus Hydrogenedentota bacterium]